MDNTTAKWLMIMFFFMVCAAPVAGLSEVYQYTDENGNLRFTDTPPKYDSEKYQRMEGMVESTAGLKDIKKKLYDLYKPETKVMEASIATVTINSSIGTGSGFFVTENGYLLTNRHVIHGDEQQAAQTEEVFEYVDEEIDRIEQRIEYDENALDEEKAYLEEISSLIEKYPEGSSRRRDLERQYKNRSERYTAYVNHLEEEKDKFEKNKNQYSSEKSDYQSRQAMAGVSRNFKITLKNGMEIYANLIRTSRDHDLALLKVDGFKTPYLKPVASGRTRQGMDVFAIGSPVNLKDTVSDGIVSGFTSDYIKTSADIYPGNSGGPLINENGEVIGINTMKELTRNFEGLGFAIPMKTALNEFGGEIR